MLGRHLIKSWSSTQGPVSLSSGEAEFYGVGKAAGVTLGYQALLEDLGVKLPVRVWTDSSAAIGICSPAANGKGALQQKAALRRLVCAARGTVTLSKVAEHRSC